MSTFTAKLKPKLSGLLEKIAHYVYYINFLILIIVGLWFYFFLQQYFIEVGTDFSFIQNNIHNISYIELDKKACDETFLLYQEKRKIDSDRRKNLKDPF